jgi:nucleotide-binding universal stress UspA family protein
VTIGVMASSARESARTATTVFDRVVCIVDGPRESLTAGRVAARIHATDGNLDVVKIHPSPHAIGHRLDAALAELERRDPTLAVVAINEHSRAVGIAVGSLGTHLLHDAPCSVLVVRDGALTDAWPESIAVGLDGLVESAAAAAAAWELSRRNGAPVHAIAATGRPGHAELELVRRIAPDFEEYDARPVTALAEISQHVDLVVVGSRGLRGVHALGSVSERVAHEARCPVLVVRGGPAWVTSGPIRP